MKTNIHQNNEDLFFTVCDNEGEEIKCEILFTFEDNATGKSYMVYTDNTKDEEGNTRVYANQFDPTGNESVLFPIAEERIWAVIEAMLADFQESSGVDDMSEEALQEELKKTLEELCALLPQHKAALKTALENPESVDHLTLIDAILHELEGVSEDN